MHKQESGTIAIRTFSLAFEQMCNVVAIADSTDQRATLRALVQQCLLLAPHGTLKAATDFAATLENVLGIAVAEDRVATAISWLLENDGLAIDQGVYYLPPDVRKTALERVEAAQRLEAEVRERWIALANTAAPSLDPQLSWRALGTFLASVFRRHGVQAVRILDPTIAVTEAHDRSVTELLNDSTQHLEDDAEDCRNAISLFLRTLGDSSSTIAYISQLADTAYNYFSLAVPPEVSDGFRKRLQNLVLLLDTNVLFGIIDLNQRSEAVSNRLVDAIRENNLPFVVRYHSETAEELKVTITEQLRQLRADRYAPEISRGAIGAGVLSGVALRYHQRNAEAPISVSAFARPYEHTDILLKDRGIDVYRAAHPNADLHKRILYEYQAFLDSANKPKPDASTRHDAHVLATAHQLRSEVKDSLAVGALFVTFDYTLYRFDQQVSRDLRLEPCAVLPEAFLQVIRPYLKSRVDYDQAFAQAFAYPEFRTITANVARAASATVDLMAGFHDLPEEVASRILSNRMLLDRVGGSASAEDAQSELQAALTHEFTVLAEERAQIAADAEVVRHERDALKADVAQAQQAIEELSEQLRKVASPPAELPAQEPDRVIQTAVSRSHERQPLATLGDVRGQAERQLVAERREHGLRIALATLLTIVLAGTFTAVTYLVPMSILLEHPRAVPLQATVYVLLLLLALVACLPRIRTMSVVASFIVGAVLLLISLL